ncbi:MAG TPA: lipoprotein [Fervidobacterium sp.]|nr:lipoprotein [Fervidobacterium sp.]
MKKVIFLVLITLVLAGCTLVTDPPDVNGLWNVSAIVSGKLYEFSLNITMNGMFFTDAESLVTDGALSTASMIRFCFEENYFYGTVSGDEIEGFVRKGEAGIVIGNWSAVRVP